MSHKTDTHRVTWMSESDQWSVRRDGAERRSGCYPTKKEAEAAGRRISQNQHTELVIHGRDGRIQRRDSHGHDPYPPKG